MSKRLCVIITLCFLSAPIVASAAPKIGEKAPVVKVSAWYNGTPPALPQDAAKDGKHIYLVEFWATWCGPCKRSIPHLSELHDQHSKEGLVVMGISNEEREVVDPFVKGNKGGKMSYHVGIDADMATNDTYMKDIGGIPHAYLVNRAGLVVWAGNPLDVASLDSAVKQLLAGKFDISAAKKAAEATQKAEELMQQLDAAYKSKNKDETFKILDQLLKLQPEELQPYLIRRQLLAAFEMNNQIAEWDVKIEQAMQKNAVGLGEFAEFQLSQDPADRDPARLMRCAMKATELSGGKDPRALSVLARAQCEMSMIDAAIDTQTKALALADKSMGDRPQKTLDYYKKVKEVSKGTPKLTAAN